MISDMVKEFKLGLMGISTMVNGKTTREQVKVYLLGRMETDIMDSS